MRQWQYTTGRSAPRTSYLTAPHRHLPRALADVVVSSWDSMQALPTGKRIRSRHAGTGAAECDRGLPARARGAVERPDLCYFRRGKEEKHAMPDQASPSGADSFDVIVIGAGPAGYPAAYYFDAMANLHLGNLDTAEQSVREAITLDSERRNPRNSYVLGLTLAAKKDFGRAVEALNAYLSAAPGAPDAEAVRKQRTEIKRLARAR